MSATNPVPVAPMPAQRRRASTGSRSPAKATAAFFILQILDEQGDPMPFSKKRVKVLAVERSAEKVLEIVEGGEHEHAFYLRGMVPPTRAPGDAPRRNVATTI